MSAARRSFVEFSATVPRDAYEEFRENFPQHGAVKWFINVALLEFNERIREQPSSKQLIDASIASMMDLSRTVAESRKQANRFILEIE